MNMLIFGYLSFVTRVTVLKMIISFRYRILTLASRFLAVGDADGQTNHASIIVGNAIGFLFFAIHVSDLISRWI